MTITHRLVPNPYVGPRAFQRGETLYGRDEEVMELLDLLIAERIVLLYSPSGAGKTSLIQAAFIPQLEAEGFQVLPVMRVNQELPPDLARTSTTNRYLMGALLSLERTLPEEQQTPLAELAMLDLATYLERWRIAHGETDSTVLIFDQFEEILTVDPTDRRAKVGFFENVGMALHDRQIWALFAMREDHIAGLDPFLNAIPTRFSSTFRLELLGEGAARWAIQEPARQAGVDLTNAAATKLVNDLRVTRVQQPDGTVAERLGPYVEPVQLQVVCRRLWEKKYPPSESGTKQIMEADRHIREADIEAVGNVDSALASYYAERVAAIAAETGISERTMRDWFDRQLITEQGIRGQVLQGPKESQGLGNRAIRSLVDAHLVRAEEQRGAIWFELAHDRLIQPVRADNAAWREANLSALQRQAALWEDQGRPDGLLLQAEALQEAEDWAAVRWGDLTSIERDFLVACQEARAIADRERRQANRIRWLAVVTSITSVFALSALFVALLFFNRAERQLRLSTSRELAAAAINNLNVDPERSILLALHAAAKTHDVDGQVAQEVEGALHKAVQASRVRLTLEGHEAEIRALAPSSDGKRLAAAGKDGRVIVWDLETGQELLTLYGHSQRVSGIAFSPDETRLATASWDGLVKIWDAESGQELFTLSSYDLPVTDVAFSPDGTRLAVTSADGTAMVWLSGSSSIGPESSAAGEAMILSGHQDWVVAVTFSPDGTRLATASIDRTAKIWDSVSGEELLTLSGHTNGVSDVAFSPDGRYLATSSQDQTAKVWDADSGRELLTLVGHTNWLLGVAFSPDGTRLATASWDRTTKLWSLESGFAELGDASSPEPLEANSPGPLEYSPPALLEASPGSAVAIGQELLTLSGHSGPVTDVAFSSACVSFRPSETSTARCEDRLVTASGDGTARVWNVSYSEELLTLTGHTDRVSSVDFSSDGTRLATSGWDGTARVWLLGASSAEQLPGGGSLAGKFAREAGTASGQVLLTLTGHLDKVREVAFSPDGTRMATASDDRSVRVWLIEPSPADASSAGFAERLPQASNPTEEMNPERMLLHVIGHRVAVIGVAFSPDGRHLATASADRTAKVWDAETREELHTLSGHEDWVVRVAFSPDGARLATASADWTAKIWDLESGRELLALSGHDGPVLGVAFSPDGMRLATTSNDGTVKVWDATSGQELLTLSGHTGPIIGVAFSPDGTRLATASNDGTAKVWPLRQVAGSAGQLPQGANLAKQLTATLDQLFRSNSIGDDVPDQEVLTLTGHEGPVVDVAFSPDGTLLATTGQDKAVRLYVMDVDGLMDLARARVTRSLTPEECQRYLHLEHCPPMP